MTPLLLDTHVWLWFCMGVEGRIPQATIGMLEKAARTGGLLVSIISIWELALLVERGRVVLPLPLRDWVFLAFSRTQIKLLGLTQPSVVIDSVNLPGELHADPADRFLIATARSRHATLVTHDQEIIRYGRAGHVRVVEV